jgi:hypothetical protein
MIKLHKNYRYAMASIIYMRGRALQRGVSKARAINDAAYIKVDTLISMALEDERASLIDLHILQKMRKSYKDLWVKSFLGN